MTLTSAAVKQADRLPAAILERVRKLLRRLRDWPQVSGAKPLTGNLAGWYRMRTGDYRVRFFLKAGNVVVDKIGHRSKFDEDEV